jgi:uroporphyrinogen-III synthase
MKIKKSTIVMIIVALLYLTRSTIVFFSSRQAVEHVVQQYQHQNIDK